MRKADFDHLIAAAAEISKEDEIVVIGSQAILGNVSDPPPSLVRSLEADLYPRRNPFLRPRSGAGDREGAGGWEQRWVRVAVRKRPGGQGEVHALCIEVHDLILAKCVAGRERDWEFAGDALAAGVVELDRLLAGVDGLPVAADHKDLLEAHLRGLGKKLGLGGEGPGA